MVLLPHSVLICLGDNIGRLLYYFLKGRRHVVEVNADLCFPEFSPEEKKQFVKDVFASSIIGFLETLFSWWASDKTLAPLVEFDGLELVKKYNQDGRGVLLIGSHFTTLDLAGRLLRFGLDLDVSYRKQSNAVFDYCIFKYRSKNFQNVVEKNEMRRLVKLVRGGRVMWLATDQDFGRKNSVFAPFFGHLAATVTSVSRILKLSDAKPLFFCHYRFKDANGQTRYRIVFKDCFGDELGDDDYKNAVLMNQAIEEAIRVAPAQYMWVHRRFKTRPDSNDAKLYQFKHKKKRRKKRS